MSAASKSREMVEVRDFPPTPQCSEPSESELDQDLCRGCDQDAKWFCPQCGDAFCSDCFEKDPAHRTDLDSRRRRSRNRPRVAHEQVDLTVYYELLDVFESKNVDTGFEWEAGAKWFYVSRAQNGDFRFGNFPRFKHLTSPGLDDECSKQFPSLVSFIGQTGAGKSTLIRMLIALKQSLGAKGGANDLYPVTGTSDSLLVMPTTGDVHLYPDQGTSGTETPLLFADCEGLDGGGQEPASLQSKASINLPFRSRKIKWASGASGLKRGDVVADLFPKVLYTFSDVVVFVLRTPRTLEQVVSEYLLPWGERSIEKAINQPCLPHAIIVLNAIENTSVGDEAWDPHVTTKQYLELLEGDLDCNPALRKMAENIPGKSIKTIRGLLEHFYATVVVMCMPSTKHFNRMHRQAAWLYDTIRKKSQESHRAKAEVGMAPNAKRMDLLISLAFDGFINRNDKPFNFLEDTVREIPNGGTFEGNILHFILLFRDVSSSPRVRYNVAELFEAVRPIISSCICLGIEREGVPGEDGELQSKGYQEHLKLAFNGFCKFWLPCTYRRKEHRCHNFKTTHGPKGHQGPNGKIIGSGPFQSDFNEVEFFKKWILKITEDLDTLDRKLPNKPTHSSPECYYTRSIEAARLHQGRMTEFLSRQVTDASDFVSHRVCLFCLRHNMPENALPCGHTLCNRCLEMFSERGKDRDTVRRLSCCPFHPPDQACSQGNLFEVHVKPPHAGVRILCLDGGGIRGIVELAILKAIEKEFKNTLMIQWFFDLVVGTSTGGIIALSLFVKNEPIDECIKNFKRFCPTAFTPREFKKVAFFHNLAAAYHGSHYKTRPLESILKEFFGTEELLFGGMKQRTEHYTKVAITATAATDKLQPTIMANYNRPVEPSPHVTYEFNREDKPKRSMRIWEAARATSAAFPHFKVFKKPEIDLELLDGGFYHNCPVRIARNESKLVWSDLEDAPPDIFLSLGTGFVSTGKAPKLSLDQRGKSHGNIIKEAQGLASAFLRAIGDCQGTWTKFLREIESNQPVERHRDRAEVESRYIRLDLELNGEVPGLDEARKVDELESLVHGRVLKAKEVAHRLVASCFYLEPGSIERVEHGAGPGYLLSGGIKCRFPEASDQLRGLGKFLGSYLQGQMQPVFLLQRGYGCRDETVASESTTIAITETIIHEMRGPGRFSLPLDEMVLSSSRITIRISLCLEQRMKYSNGESHLPISRSPRELDAEELVRGAGGYHHSWGLSTGETRSSPPPPPYSP